MSDRCDLCRFYGEPNRIRNKYGDYCRRYPPVAILLAGEDPPGTPGSHRTGSALPTVAPDWNCGEFRPVARAPLAAVRRPSFFDRLTARIRRHV